MRCASLAGRQIPEEGTGMAAGGGGWSCPHDVDGRCGKVNMLPCDPGMKGCELYGRFAFFNDDKNARLREKRAREARAAGPESGGKTPEGPTGAD